MLGTELSGSWGNVEGSSSNCLQGDFAPDVTFDCRARQNWTVQWLNKLGYTFGTDHRLLAYVTGGVAASGLSINRKIEGDGVIQTEFGSSTTFVGGVLGGGFQYAFTNSLSLGVEYLHAEYADSDVNITVSRQPCGGGCEPLHASVTEQFSTDTVRAVLNYKIRGAPRGCTSEVAYRGSCRLPFNPLPSRLSLAVLVAPVLSLASPITGAAFIPNSTNIEKYY